jgi:DNA (cytosine-5)-methyltransferase 1
MDRPIPVIDLFAGPGGLGEGFCSLGRPEGTPRFAIRLSIEKDCIAHRTLELRAFFRQFPHGLAPNEYYRYLRGQLTREELFQALPKQAAAATHEAWQAELGVVDTEEVRARIERALGGTENWVLIGGPPCQAYSLVGRSRNKGIAGYALATDPKVRLYLQYLQIIANFWPAVFVMENVKGLLSAQIDGEHIFDEIQRDLKEPGEALEPRGGKAREKKRHSYELHSLVQPEPGLFKSAPEFLIRSEQYGIPQARHRVIVVGVRDDLKGKVLPLLRPDAAPSVEQMLQDLPPVRSGLSKEPDDEWLEAVLEICRPNRLRSLRGIDDHVRDRLERMPSRAARMKRLERGAEFIEHNPCIQFKREWFVDKRLGGICNHSTRSHIRSDLHRYLFAAIYAEVHKNSPELANFPRELLPEHDNVQKALQGATFADRFRVQHRHRYATTVTSHISKDGHYYIHYASDQCRSLTVREAARLQTFPDNYFFEGPRTSQYAQVGNAVPPLLARQMAECVYEVLKR